MKAIFTRTTEAGQEAIGEVWIDDAGAIAHSLPAEVWELLQAGVITQVADPWEDAEAERLIFPASADPAAFIQALPITFLGSMLRVQVKE
jgi:hypothetical protein